ncbi:MAG: hypothetical protein GWP10_13425 [Nitrospiraceae bacterium]|nr:hypothetical protein [Nitrospiraceae bacterium]
MIVNIRMTSTHNFEVPILIVSYISTKNNHSNCSSVHFKLKPNKELFPLLKDIMTSKKASDAEDFINTVVDLSSKKVYPPSLQKITLAINNMNSLNMNSTISRLYINNRLLPKVKLINIINNVAYFVIRKHYFDKSEYILEPVSNAKCIIPSSNLVLIYRMAKIKVFKNKMSFKKLKQKFQFREFKIPNPYHRHQAPRNIELSIEDFNPGGDIHEIITRAPSLHDTTSCRHNTISANPHYFISSTGHVCNR